MTILLLGGTRFIGRAVLQELLCHQHKVAVLSRRTGDVPDGVTVFCGERDEWLARAAAALDVNLVLDFTAYQEQDVTRALSLFPNAAYWLISSLWVSKLAAGQRTDGPAERFDLDACDLLEQTRTYICDKARCEAAVLAAHAAGRQARVLRLPIVMGEQDHTRRLDFYWQRLRDNCGVFLVNGGQNRVTLAYKHDVALAIARLITRDLATLPVIMEAVPPDATLTMRELLRHLARVIHRPLLTCELGADVLRSELADYLAQEPFWRETELLPSANNLFLLSATEPTPVGVWLQAVAHQSLPESVADPLLRQRERRLMADIRSALHA